MSNTRTATVLLVEDERALREALARSLQRMGYSPLACADAASADAALRSHAPDAVLLDLSLPDEDGLLWLSRARSAGMRAPVLILTARGTVGDRILGLNNGADDYLPKPFDLDELEARLAALLRRSSGGIAPQVHDEKMLNRRRVYSVLSYAINSNSFLLNAQRIDLTPRELRLMKALFERPGHAVTKERLLEAVFGHEESVNDDAIEVVVYRVRKKLSDSGVSIATLRGLGYALQRSAA
jgi:two-component system, OmpR family, response regulator TctD